MVLRNANLHLFFLCQVHVDDVGAKKDSTTVTPDVVGAEKDSTTVTPPAEKLKDFLISRCLRVQSKSLLTKSRLNKIAHPKNLNEAGSKSIWLCKSLDGSDAPKKCKGGNGGGSLKDPHVITTSNEGGYNCVPITKFKSEKKTGTFSTVHQHTALVLTVTPPAQPDKTYTIGFPFTTAEKEGDGETRTYTENVPVMKEKVMKLMEDLVENKECIMKKKTAFKKCLDLRHKKHKNAIIFHETFLKYNKKHCCTAKGKTQVDEAQAAIGDELQNKLDKFLPKN